MGNEWLMSEIALGRGQLDNMIETLIRVSALAESNVRDVRVNDLEATLRRPLVASRSVEIREDISSLVAAANACSGGLIAFTRIIQRHHPGEAASRAAALAADIAGPWLLSTPDREALRQQLSQIGIWQVADALGDLSTVAELSSLQVWREIPTAIRLMERLPVADEVPPLLAFVARLAGILDDAQAGKLWQWLDIVAGGLGVSSGAFDALRGGKPTGTPATRPSTSLERSPRARRSDESGIIWGSVPIRNRNFTGRAVLLDRLAEALRTSSKASVLPQTLHGMGGVGKTQLVVEYVYRHLDEYDLVWWIPAEQTASVLTSLAQLGERLGLNPTEDKQQTGRAVLDALASGQLTWLLVYDNADDPDALDQYVPTTGGHFILTTRNQDWAKVGPAIEVDVFERAESIELLRKRSDGRIRTAEADELADRLGDLPLALEQAAAWHLATAMPIEEYLELLEHRMKDLLSEGKPASYPLSVAAFVTLAVEKLRETAPATAQMLELFAYLGGEPVPVSLLQSGKDAEVSEPLKSVLSDSVMVNRIVRDLNSLGLAKVDVAQRMQVHRLVQRVLRETMAVGRAEQTLRNTRNLLARANPGDPDEVGQHGRQREMGPHLEPADMIHADSLDARQAVLDHGRFLYITGDYENSRLLASKAAAVWEKEEDEDKMGPDGQFTLRARAQMSNAMRALGESQPAGRLSRDTYDRMKRSPRIGPRHEFTLIHGNQVGSDLRILGKYRDALDFELESVMLHREVFGLEHPYTLRAQTNLAVAYRLIGSFAEAFEIQRDIAGHWEDVGGTDWRELEAYMNVARDYYGMGAYRAGLALLERWRGPLQDTLGSSNRLVLLAGRTYGITLRKAGRLTEAVEVLRENRDMTLSRFKHTPNHEYSVAALVSYGNALRELDDLDGASEQLNEALSRYRADYGDRHPLTLVTRVNEAIVRRAAGDLDAATATDADCYAALGEVLSPEHPYTLCAGTALATDHALAGNHTEALRLSNQMLEVSRATSGGRHEARDGAEHPYVLMRAVNLSQDLRTTGMTDDADALFQESLSGLRSALGAGHPEVAAIEQGKRTEGDIEAPPT